MHKIDYLEPEIEEYLQLKKHSTANVYRSNLRIFVEYYQSVYGKDKTISDFLDSIFDEFKKPRREQRRIAEIVRLKNDVWFSKLSNEQIISVEEFLESRKRAWD